MCLDLKAAKLEKETTLKEKNLLSVALTAKKKELQNCAERFEDERNIYKSEFETLNHYKIEKDAELRK